jgi:hypothetical protein
MLFRTNTGSSGTATETETETETETGTGRLRRSLVEAFPFLILDLLVFDFSNQIADALSEIVSEDAYEGASLRNGIITMNGFFGDPLGGRFQMF